MLEDIISTFLVSISPIGESRAGIPFGLVSGLPISWAFLAGLLGNLLVFPIFNFLINQLDHRLWQFHNYRTISLWMMRRSKKLIGKHVSRYGFWGLMIFVMIPLPITGAYMGVIGAKVFRIHTKPAFIAISIGVTISAGLVTGVSHFIA
mgnify:CR=1 FL=1